MILHPIVQNDDATYTQYEEAIPDNWVDFYCGTGRTPKEDEADDIHSLVVLDGDIVWFCNETTEDLAGFFPDATELTREEFEERFGDSK